MRILFVMDSLKNLDPLWDNSLYLSDEFARRGHENWVCDAPNLRAKNKSVYAQCGHLIGEGRSWPHRNYRITSRQVWDLKNFDLVLIRKEPPVDRSFLKMTALLERLASRVPMVNHPRGIRLTNEKLSILDFPKWIPKTLVTASPNSILRFQQKTGNQIVVKPLDQKGGKGVFLLSKNPKTALSQLRTATHKSKVKVMAQEFIEGKQQGEKRIVLLGAKFFAAYEKRAKRGEFRANLGLGASFHRASLSRKEKNLINDLRPYLLKRGLYFVGIDVLGAKLIEINVTSPAGVTEAKFLNPKQPLAEAWADWLERFARAQKGRS